MRLRSRNDEVAELLDEFADRLESKGVEYKPRAYRRAAESVREAPPDALDSPRSIDDVGDAIASKIDEFLETGEIDELNELRGETPEGMDEMTSVEGVGPRIAGKLYEALGVEDLDDLEQAALHNRIRNVEGFGEKTEENILDGIEFAREKHERKRLGDALPLARNVVDRLEAHEAVERAETAGSIRRRRETVGDIDVVVASVSGEEVSEFVTDWDLVTEVVQQGDTKTSVFLGTEGDDTRLDVHVVEDDEFGSALQYFTGSKSHNVALRNVALDQGFKLNEYGLWEKKEEESDGENRGERVAGETEEGIYDALDLEHVPPELREDRGEIEAATEDSEGELPALVEVEEIRGDLHTHTSRTDGNASLEEMVDAAVGHGHEYVAVTDHTQELTIADGLTDDELVELARDAGALDDDRDDVRVFAGAEANVLEDGGLDVSDDVLAELDVVVASVHTRMRMEKEEATRRLVSAVEHDEVDVLGHPSGRLINDREGYPYDFDEVLEAAKREGVALELNANPHRLDVWDSQVRRAVDEDVLVSVNTDAHSTSDYSNLRYGVATARRGWAEADDVLNTMRTEEIEEWLGS